MRIYGSFRNIINELVSVEIITHGSTTVQKEIKKENGLWFSGDPVQITCEIEDTFQHLIKKSATINLVTRNYLGDTLFANNARDIEVTITKNGQCLFFGYLEPNTYEQGFALPLEEFTLNCIDALSTLQYYKYNDITLSNFNLKKSTSTLKTFKQLVNICLTQDIVKGAILYDKSKGVDTLSVATLFDDLSINDSYIIGEDYEDVWTCEQVLEETLKYLNLHIIQMGYDYYIFDWETLKNQESSFVNLVDDTTYQIAFHNTLLTGSLHASDDTNITIGEVYNQISVKDNLESLNEIIQSPFNKDTIDGYNNGKQLYMTEYFAEGSGDNAHDAVVNMVRGKPTTYKNAKQIDWYMQALKSKTWKLYHNGVSVDNLMEKTQQGEYINQWKVAKYLKEHSLTPFMFKMGSVEIPLSSTADNSPKSKITMQNYLYISINGNEYEGEQTHSPSDADIENAQPMVEYISGNSGGVYSPVDDKTTNYLVFSGSLLLQPIVYESSQTFADRVNNYQNIYDHGMRKTEGTDAIVPYYEGYEHRPTQPYLQSNLVKSANNSEGRYYTRKFWTIEHPTDVESTYLTDGSAGVQPPTDDQSAHGYKYNYTAKWDNVDKYSKLPILECELIIGNKRLVEENMDEYGNSEFHWYPLGEEPTVEQDGQTYTLKTFSLGVNPKIEDYIIGQEHNLQNTISYRMNLETEGTAIPIKKSDALSGAVIFRILGPVNSLWNQVNRRTHRHVIFWRHTTWSSQMHFIMSHVENIIIKNFECKVFTDNAGYETYENNDLIYMSDETTRFVNKKDDIEFNFVTQLTTDEALQKGIKTSINVNAVINHNTGQAITSLYNALTDETAKPEEHYINQYYTEYSEPKIIMTSTLHMTPTLTDKFHSNILNKDFIPLSNEFNVKNNTTTIQMKQI